MKYPELSASRTRATSLDAFIKSVIMSGLRKKKLTGAMRPVRVLCSREVEMLRNFQEC
jgi:hypothetical protein